MIRILHTSDLHFSGKNPDELAYSTTVWKNILDLAKEQKVEAILISGDVFDTFTDLEKYRNQFIQETKNLDIPIYAIAGNHEYLRKSPAESLASFGMGCIHWYFQEDFALIEPNSGKWELAILPYSEKYSEYQNWKIPSKGKFRILMAHGMIPEAVSYTGPSEEEGDHLLELNLLANFQADYIALGHIHKKTSLKLGTNHLYYPGSPRVWRKGEDGFRTVNIIEIDNNKLLNVSEQIVVKAGRYIEENLQILPNGHLPDWSLEKIQASPYDYVHIVLSGFADSQSIVEENINKLETTNKGAVRKLIIDAESVQYMDGISGNSLVHKFLKLWQEKFDNQNNDKDREVLLEARQIGLQAISDRIKGKK
ncbi:MAG: metallophosphoesterase [Leptospira sp.]|nr:metallophosphoesterase [Leptospira sp.]